MTTTNTNPLGVFDAPGDYPRDVLSAAFDRVCDPADWRAPIRAVVSRGDLDVTLRAVAYFTGAPVTHDSDPDSDGVRVSCVGDRSGPGGP